MTVYKKLSEMKKNEVFVYNNKVLLTFIKKTFMPNVYKTKNFDNNKMVYCLDLGTSFKMVLYNKKEG